MLLHATYKRPQILTSELWTFSVRKYVNIRKDMPQEGKEKFPCKLFTDKQ